MNKLDRGTVQHTLCIPLAGRMIAAQKYPELSLTRTQSAS